MCSKNTKQLQFSSSCPKGKRETESVSFYRHILYLKVGSDNEVTRVLKMMYIVVMEGTVLNPNELNIRVIMACRLTVIYRQKARLC